ncbi:hypothetical protein D3D02_11755 [Halobellus sp. Atlit-38R]|uniref:hypothetical protein n=1 Tax=Halobellus sp. Atlit-38R TaxID=2282131 RepID=UPI000EF19319|nr:hypothetical protein [Halobellus sp. Atlit-38R]RLM88662.1 hypothetical protein D3D02_11755 [Halobellus sp. Atlit-38R]
MKRSPPAVKKQTVTNEDAQLTITADTPVVTSAYFDRPGTERIYHLRASDTETPKPRCSCAGRSDTDWQPATRGELPAKATLCERCDPYTDIPTDPTHSLAAKLAREDVRSVTDLDADELRTDGGTDPLTRARQQLTQAITHSYAGRDTQARATIREAMQLLDAHGHAPETNAVAPDDNAQGVRNADPETIGAPSCHPGEELTDE